MYKFGTTVVVVRTSSRDEEHQYTAAKLLPVSVGLVDQDTDPERQFGDLRRRFA